MGHFSGDLMSNQEPAIRSNSPLVDYALRGLDRCWLPEFGRWSHIYHLDDRKQANESVPPSDVFYTLNVLLGMARVPRVPPHIDLSGTFLRNVREHARSGPRRPHLQRAECDDPIITHNSRNDARAG
jgi:hypothetical protein